MSLSSRALLITALFMPCFMTPLAFAKGHSPSDDEVKQAIIDESIASYPGTCACPFNQARNGSHCGGRSAWSRAGGYSPLCYKKEVTDEMVKDWRESHHG